MDFAGLTKNVVAACSGQRTRHERRHPTRHRSSSTIELCGLCLSRSAALDNDQEQRPVGHDSGDVQSCHGSIFSLARNEKYV